MVTKSRRRNDAVTHRYKLGLDPKPGQAVKAYNRCRLCGRPHGYMRKFDLCRICFRELARAGKLMGVRKSSW